ncbi:unnamed protein product [Arctogadus glacialis]
MEFPIDSLFHQAMKMTLLMGLLAVNTRAIETVNVVDFCGQTIKGDGMVFYDGRERSSPPVGPPLCGKSPPRPVLSTGNYLTLRLVTRGTQPRVDFVGDFTSFRLGIDNCGDGSDLEENLTSGCKGQLVAHTSPPTIATGASVLTALASTASTVPVSLLALYVALGVLADALLLCWCCWSPAWFLWRFSVCRHLPCCNTTCSACQLCLRGCGHHGENRPIKVTPHNPVSGTLLRPVAPEANASSTTVAV